jgi:hypothetical protein
MGMISIKKNSLRAKASSLGRRHCRKYSVSPGLIIGSGHHSSRPRAPNHNGLADQFRMATHFNGHIKSIHIYVEDGSGRVLFFHSERDSTIITDVALEVAE